MAELPKKNKAAVYDKPGTISTKIVELDMPEPAAGEVLVNLYDRVPLCNTTMDDALTWVSAALTRASAIQTWAS